MFPTTSHVAKLCLSAVLRVWDVLLYDGNRSMLFRTTLALLEQHGKGSSLLDVFFVYSNFLEQTKIVKFHGN